MRAAVPRYACGPSVSVPRHAQSRSELCVNNFPSPQLCAHPSDQGRQQRPRSVAPAGAPLFPAQCVFRDMREGWLWAWAWRSDPIGPCPAFRVMRSTDPSRRQLFLCASTDQGVPSYAHKQDQRSETCVLRPIADCGVSAEALPRAFRVMRVFHGGVWRAFEARAFRVMRYGRCRTVPRYAGDNLSTGQAWRSELCARKG